MKQIILIILITCLVSTSWAAAVQVEGTLTQAVIPGEIYASSITLAELAGKLSIDSGITVAVAPEVAELTVEIQFAPQQRLEKILRSLCEKYQLAFKYNNKQNAVILFKAPYTAFDMAAPSIMHKSSLPEMYRSSVVQAPPVYYPSGSWNTEEYKHFYDNRFQETMSSPVSTFSIDVDTASYSNIRRFINSGALPPADAVRTEEMINYFSYEYPQPVNDKPVTLTTEVMACPWQPAHQLVMIGLQGKRLEKQELPPGNLAFLIDVSGSMAEQNKLPLLKSAFKMLVKELRDQDRVSIVAYAGSAGVVLEPTPGSNKEKIMAAIDSLEAGGSTAGGEGIKLAYSIAKKNFLPSGNNRVILTTDGDFNVGVSSEGELVRLIEDQRNEGIFLSVIGVGAGNLKDSKMEALADKGNGNYAYIDTAQEAKKVMVGQMAGTLYTIAKAVKLQVEFNPAKVKQYRLLGYENRMLDKQDFNDDKKDAGDMGASHSVSALYEVVPVGADDMPGSDPLRYQQTQIVPSEELFQVKMRYKEPAEERSQLLVEHIMDRKGADIPSDNIRFAAAVAEYAMLLRNSEYKGQSSYNQVIELAQRARGQDAEGYRSEFIRMVELSQLLDDR